MKNKQELAEVGFTILDNVFTDTEIGEILTIIESNDSSKETFRKSTNLFAIRQFLKEIPEIQSHVFNENLISLIKTFLGDDFFVVKSIYFDKPQKSNWFVSYHQDLTISVDKKIEIFNYGPWTIKQDQYAVQPPLNILNSIYTIRIHLDDTDENNGALKVITGSHLKGIYRPDTIDRTREKEIVCAVPKGGVMIMRPLLLHSSARTMNNNQRRVIHIELSNADIDTNLNWAEKSTIS